MPTIILNLTDDEMEWCVMHPSFPDEPHRGPMTEAEARAWVGDDDTPQGLFYIAHRLIGPWKAADEAK